uniref:Uncharacterized protein n=1 Tax=Mustela putorius furo TaxID=9669 RepID=M3XLT9_MUSPF
MLQFQNHGRKMKHDFRWGEIPACPPPPPRPRRSLGCRRKKAPALQAASLGPKWRLHAQERRPRRLRGLWAGQRAGPRAGIAAAPGLGPWAWPTRGEERVRRAELEGWGQAGTRGGEMGGTEPYWAPCTR